MKKIVSTFLLFIGLTSFGQIQKGIVVDTLGNPIENAYLINEISKAHAHTDDF